jgi:hypothetical protein
MVRRLVLLTLVASLVPLPAFADLREAIAREAALAARQATPTLRANPYKTPAIALMVGGAGILVLGLLQERGAEVSTVGTAAGAAVSVTEKGGSKTTLTVLGAVAGASGAALWFLGENKRNAAPSRIWWSPSAAGITHTLSF